MTIPAHHEKVGPAYCSLRIFLNHFTGSHDDMRPSTPTSSSSFGFGANRNIPFIFATPSRQGIEPYSWAPPSTVSSATMFPSPSIDEPKDIDMSEASPPKPEEPKELKPDNDRAVATGALRRVYRARHKTPRGRRTVQARNRGSETDDDDEATDEELDLMNQNTSNHYTLNMSSAPSRSDMPYILLG